MSDSNKAVKILVSIPNEGHTNVEAYANRLENFLYLGTLQERGLQEKREPRFEFFPITLGRILTPLAREEAARCAIENNMDYIFFIDDDMICPNNMFEMLYRHNVDIVAPLAFTRNFPHHAVIYDVKEGWDSVANSEYFINHYIDDYPKNELVECDAVGFGAALIKVDVLRKMSRPYFMSTCGSGEDIFFCHKARKIGARVFMDTSCKLGHLSHPIEVTEEYVEKVRKEYNYKEALPLKSKRQFNKNEATLILGD
jgi:GT2 family glycosyltransferase